MEFIREDCIYARQSVDRKECNDILRTPGTVFAYRYIGSSQPENTRRLWQNTKKDMVQVRQTLKSAR